MKLEKILDNINSFEKNAFLKIIDGIISNKPRNAKEIDKILTDSSRELKSMDNINISRVFRLVEAEFTAIIKEQFMNTTSQLDVLVDLLSRDGNAIMKQDWFARLYEQELKALSVKLKSFQKNLEDEKSELPSERRRDYMIYKACLETAYHNDDDNNQERRITTDEHSIILTLSAQLGLSQEEIKMINYLILPIKKMEIDPLLNELRTMGVIFYAKKTSTIYVADEIVQILRKVRGKEIADKFYRRILRQLREPQINLICRTHQIDWKLPLEQKIKEIIIEGVSLTGVLTNDIHKAGTSVTEKKKFVSELSDQKLQISPSLKGTLLEEKIENLIKYFDEVERDEKVGISIDGYEKMLLELGEVNTSLNSKLRAEFELQEEHVLKSGFLLDFNIKPRDVLEILTAEELDTFCKTKEIKTRGDQILNILEAYKDAENLYLENYANIGFRNYSALKENGILIKEAELGNKFEELTKKLFTQLGFNVDDKLRKEINNNKDQADIILNMGNNELMIIECKTVKESGYNKFSNVARQLKAYSSRAVLCNYTVKKILLVAPDFSDDFIKECGLDFELNLSLITAASLLNITEGFKHSKHKTFPENLLMRDVLIQEDRVLKAIGK
jgi:ribosome-associated translation inhibitor RaiA